jgi:hypothetical protein
MLATVKQLGNNLGLVGWACPLCQGPHSEGLVELQADPEPLQCVCGCFMRIGTAALLQWETLHREVRNAG